MKDEHAKEIISQLDSINCRLTDIQHFIQEIESNGLLDREVTEAIVWIARSQSKELDKHYKMLLNSKGAKV